MSKFEQNQADELEATLTDEEKQFLDAIADRIARRRMTAAALFFLESMKPLGWVGSQMMYFFRPFVQALWSDPKTWDRVAKLLERRGSIELLLRRLEARA